MRLRGFAIAFSVLALGLWGAAGVLLSENGLRVPRRPATQDSPPSRAVEINAADGVILRGSFLSASTAGDCVLLLHGIADSRHSSLGFAPMFLQAGYSVLAPDSRANGSSGGELVTFGVLERLDVLRWTSWMRQQGCRRIFGLGESLGAGILIQAAAEAPDFAAIAAESPFTDLPSIAQYRVSRMLGGPAWLSSLLSKAIVQASLVYTRMRYHVDLAGASPLESARRLKTPLLLIHGAEDGNTPPSHSLAIAANDPGALLWLVPGAGHTGAASREPAQFRAHVLEWFESHRLAAAR